MVIFMNQSAVIERKTVSITGKRQITIPQKFFAALGFQHEADCIMRDGEIVLRPKNEDTGGEFAEEILADLIKQGYSGSELLERFRMTRKKVRPAVERMLDEAREAAAGKGESYSYEEVFGEQRK